MIPSKFAGAGRTAYRVAGLLLTCGLQAAWLAQPWSWHVKVFQAALLTLAVARPRDALLVVAALAPLSTSLAGLLHGAMSGWVLLFGMLLAVVTGFLIRAPSPSVPSRLAMPAVLLGTIAVASALVAVASDPAFITAYPQPGSAAQDLLKRDLFVWSRPWIPLQQALFLSAALLTATATERAIRANPTDAHRLVLLLVVGHAASIVISFSRFLTAALADGNVLATLLRIVTDVRYHSQYDVNAAGSTLVLVAFAALGLSAKDRLWAIGAALLTLAGVWFTGSRAALAAFAGVMVLRACVRLAFAGGRRAWMGAAAIVAAAAVLSALAAMYYPEGRNVSTSVAWEARSIMLRTAWRAGLSDPLFGVGIGMLPERGPDFGSADMRPLMGESGTHENAHNQFLQTFAETGLLGLLALLLVIGSAGWGIGLTGAGPRLHSWISWGILAAILTWMLGHPLLVPEAAFVFWLALGICAGLSPVPQPGGWPGRLGVAALALTLLVAIATPLRLAGATRRASLEHQAVGLSPYWEHGGQFPYRVGGRTFALFVPSGRSVAVPLRLAPGAVDSLLVEIRLQGRLIDRIEIIENAWRPVGIVIPEPQREFERVEFELVGAGEETLNVARVHVGRMIVR